MILRGNITIILLLLLSSCSPKSICDHGTMEEQVGCLKNLPREHFQGLSGIIKQGGVYYSLTTSPERLSKLHYVLETLDFSIPEKVFIVLPLKYKNKELYSDIEIEQVRAYSPKIHILRPGHDLGPIMKLVPAIEELQKDPSDLAHKIAITFDDDTGYPAGLPEQLVKYSVQLNAVVAGSAQDATAWGINNFIHSKNSCGRSEISNCDIVEGFHGVAYPVNQVDTGLMKAIAGIPVCRLSDDLVISYVLAKKGVKRVLIRNKYTENLLQFEYGFGADALHRTKPDGSSGGGHYHGDKYRKCMQAILGRSD